MKSGSRDAGKKYEKRRRIEERADAEAEWFYRVHAGRVPADAFSVEGAAARRIEQWLTKLAPFHRGAFALRYTPRTWPEPLVDEFQGAASLIVRLECAQHPAVGKSVAELEEASVARLMALITEATRERERRKGRGTLPGPCGIQLGRLTVRAWLHMASAVRAFAKVRGDVPCVAPGWVEPKAGACK